MTRCCHIMGDIIEQMFDKMKYIDIILNILQKYLFFYKNVTHYFDF